MDDHRLITAEERAKALNYEPVEERAKALNYEH
jgi:hypothetical protein